MRYRLQEIGVLREDGASIPNDPRNRDWQEYQNWLAEGNQPDPPVVETTEPKNPLFAYFDLLSPEDKIKLFTVIREGLAKV